MAGDGEDAQPFTVDAIDAKGRHVATANLPVEFAITGGEIIGLGNGDPNSHEPAKGNRRSLFNGLAQVIVQASDGTGSLTLAATSPGLRTARSKVRLTNARARAQVPSTKPILIVQGWRQSPNGAVRIDPNIVVPENDMNSWINVSSSIQSNGTGEWNLFRTKFTPRKRTRERGGRLIFADITGAAEVWIDGTLRARKPDPAPARFAVPLERGKGERTVSVVVQSSGGQQGGLGGIVFVEDY